MSAHMTSIDKTLSKYKNDTKFKTLLDNYTKFANAKDEFIKTEESNLSQVGTVAPAHIVNFEKTKSDLVSSFDEIISKHVSSAKATYEASKKVFGTTLTIIISLVVLCLIITFILTVVIIRETVYPIKTVTAKLKEISQSNGDLTQRIGYQSKDEMGELSSNFDLFMDKIQSIIKIVLINSKQRAVKK